MINAHIIRIVLLVGCFKTYQAVVSVSYCNFEDTVDLTHSQKFTNGSYLYGDDLIIPAEQVSIYDYEIIYDGDRISREPHPRGCVCRPGERSCIKFCCHPQRQALSNSSRQCEELYEVPKFNHNMKVISLNGTRRIVDITKEFTMVLGIPCDNAYPLNPLMNLHEKWNLLENGSLVLYYNLRILSKSEYCFMPELRSDNAIIGGSPWVLSPMICPVAKPVSISRLFNNVADCISIVFLVLTILVILVKPEKINLQENSLMCFLVALTIGNIIVASTYISDTQLTGIWCSIVGLAGYFFSVVSFFWLNVIFFDLLKSIVNRENHFVTYLAYGWGVPAALTAVLLIIQNSNMPEKYKPGFGEESCWFNSNNFSALFYLYGLNIFLLCLNIFYYITTWHKMKSVLQHQPTRKDDLVKSADQYGRLLILMIVLACFETISNIESVLHPNSETIWYFVADFVDALEGPVIFWIFAVRPIIDIRRNRFLENGNRYDPLDEGITLSDAPGFKAENGHQIYDRF
ncbi:G-protein coupled receptor Mth2 [Musca domestica]|uniref:G-protein coupled receptor Mth2 n=1 Tax=Musca domestica TaxID=7370 RepID=A0A1I8M5F6_MUSDO|nr:G-protein coupled receptor Mth2 [Musca domestica]XP_058982397.1 G-protein coupled receptor Mth2 [Musca domestica]